MKKYIYIMLTVIIFCLSGCVSSQNYELTPATENEICQSYWDTYVKESETITAADLSAECVYHEDEIFAVFIHDPRLTYTMARRNESVGGITLTFDNGQPLYIYHQGQIYDLSTAYENKIIGADYLQNLKEALN